MKINFLTHHFYGLGGVNSALASLAGELSKSHEVEIVTVFRRGDRAMFSLPENVAVRPLVDLRQHAPSMDIDNPLVHEPPRFLPAQDGGRNYSRLAEVRISEYLAEVDSDVVVGTQPVMGIALGTFPGRYVSIYQVHTSALDRQVGDQLRMVSHGIDAIVPVSRGLVGKYAKLVAGLDVHVEAIHNSVSVPVAVDASSDSKIIMAAGRLVTAKRYNDIIQSFSELAEKHPEWSVRIYGSGAEEGNLRSLVSELGLNDRVLLMGSTRFMDSEWSKAGIAVSASRAESFGMTLVEAMRLGVPAVAADCNFGPREIVSHGVDGFLVPVGDVAAMVESLDRLMSAPGRRAEMGAAAQQNMHRFRPDRIAAQWEDLFDRLDRRRHLPSTASWTVDGQNTIRIRVMAPAASPNGLQLLARRSGVAPELSFPFVLDSVDPDGGSLYEATIMADDHSLGDGEWSLHISTGEAGEERALSGDWYDDRALVDYFPWHEDAIRVRLPFVNQEGNIRISSRVRQRWAEVEKIDTTPTGFRFTARVFGFQTANGAHQLVAVSRVDGGQGVPLSMTHHGDATFEANVHYADLMPLAQSENNLWDLVFTSPDEDEQIRVGRLAGDYANKKSVHNYPFLPVPQPDENDAAAEAAFRGKPYFTPQGHLAIVLRRN
ncbi:glycosyltransferase family 4 protein [Streptomyces sp. NBC_00006]|uniref:glycosyltransferase family 4 protein n=1 Tax=Streptomyces sp. NBC_00006 TaxID=2975619 RepID=UPI00225931CA|nr:glycosyltransferase family 4 protein [Streptomyces sp. NBC_00006]MCX5535285.1 glycosyltransferase family 4 protein [Streptomyces sp. NBC_00006]